MADVSYFGDTGARWSALQLWQAMKMIVAAPGGTVPYWTLRDTVFGGNDDVILSLIKSKLTVFEACKSFPFHATPPGIVLYMHCTPSPVTLCILLHSVYYIPLATRIALHTPRRTFCMHFHLSLAHNE